MVFKQKHICRKIFLSKITSYTKKCVGAVFSMHRFSSFWTFWKPFDPIQHLRGITFWILNFWQNWATLENFPNFLPVLIAKVELGWPTGHCLGELKWTLLDSFTHPNFAIIYHQCKYMAMTYLGNMLPLAQFGWPNA